MQNTLVKVLALSVFTVSLFLQACQPVDRTGNVASNSSIEPRGVGQRGGRLVHRISAPLKTFNYLMADDEPSVTATVYLLGSRLAALDHSTQEFVPALAEKWTTSADGLTVDVKLRNGLKFSDGQPLTADDVIFTLESAYDKRTNSPVFRDALLVNGKEIQTKRISETDLQLILPEKVAGVENYLDNLVILPKHVLGKDRESGTLSEAWKIDSDPSKIVTSGPFMVESSTPGTQVVFKRNPHYWKTDAAGTQLPYLDNLVLEIVSEPNNAFSRLGQQEIDIFDRIRAGDYVSLRDGTGPVRAIDLGPGQSNDHFWFNQNKAKKDGERLDDKPKYAWFTDSRFRKAISHAVDRETIARTTLQGLASPLYGFVPAGNKVWLDPDLPKTAFDLDRSRSLLTEAGFLNRGTTEAPELVDAKGNVVEFTLIVQSTNEERKLEAAVIQQDLAKLGIKMNIAPLDTTGVMLRAGDTLDYEAILFGLTLTGIDPSGFANFLPSNAATHQWHPSQKEPATEWEARVDKLFSEQAAELDLAKRKQLMFEIQKIMVEEVPVIPVVSRHIVSAANKRVGNHAPSTILPYSLWNCEELFIRQ